jgi:hypothetical protein
LKEQALSSTNGKIDGLNLQEEGVRNVTQAHPRYVWRVLIYAYMVLTLLAGLLAIWRDGALAGIAGIIGPTLCWFAASGLKGSLLMGDSQQKLGGLGGAVATVAAGAGMVYYTGYLVEIWSLAIDGVIWCVVGFITSWISTTRSQAIAMKT